MTEDFMTKATLTLTGLVAINQAIASLSQFNVIQNVIPEYAKWVFVGIGALGAYYLYTMYKR